MKPFESFLREYLEEYIAYCQKLGYEGRNIRQRLSYLDRAVQSQQAQWESLTPSFFLTLRAHLAVAPRTANAIFTTLRGFFSYLQRIEYWEKNPLVDIPHLPELRFIPFVFSPEEIDLLLRTIQKGIRKAQRHFLNDLAEYIAILLLARCGLRISEPTRLLLTHVRVQEATIYIEKTKFKKDRLIPVPHSVIKEIENYLAVRSSLLEDTIPYLLISGKQKKLTCRRLYYPFNRAVKEIGLDQPKKVLANTTFGRPTPHSLRHAFAVNTLKRIKEQGKSPQHALPILAAYMGHRHYQDTAIYLKVLDAQQRRQLLHCAQSRSAL
ncbi:MAG: tyrosine-type recombinase/integrase [Campylobacterales bacterium]|nr:tyrosine-type recombinase/integrase [Campylobacterales bacterium]